MDKTVQRQDVLIVIHQPAVDGIVVRNRSGVEKTVPFKYTHRGGISHRDGCKQSFNSVGQQVLCHDGNCLRRITPAPRMHKKSSSQN